jgi:hypothetical protein
MFTTATIIAGMGIVAIGAAALVARLAEGRRGPKHKRLP